MSIEERHRADLLLDQISRIPSRHEHEKQHRVDVRRQVVGGRRETARSGAPARRAESQRRARRRLATPRGCRRRESRTRRPRAARAASARASSGVDRPGSTSTMSPPRSIERERDRARARAASSAVGTARRAPRSARARVRVRASSCSGSSAAASNAYVTSASTASRSSALSRVRQPSRSTSGHRRLRRVEQRIGRRGRRATSRAAIASMRDSSCGGGAGLRPRIQADSGPGAAVTCSTLTRRQAARARCPAGGLTPRESWPRRECPPAPCAACRRHGHPPPPRAP